jgi:hypothetical protein
MTIIYNTTAGKKQATIMCKPEKGPSQCRNIDASGQVTGDLQPVVALAYHGAAGGELPKPLRTGSGMGVPGRLRAYRQTWQV